MNVRSLGWLGVRTAKAAAMSGFCRDVLGLEPIDEHLSGARFRMADGVEVHVYDGDDADHDFFGAGPVVGFAVHSFSAVRARMAKAGIEFVYPDPQRKSGRAWQHFRAPDGNVYEIIGPDDAARVHVRTFEPSDKDWVGETWRERWGSARVVTISGAHELIQLPALVAELDGAPIGVLAYRLGDGDCEIVALDSLQEGIGAGTALLNAAHDVARSSASRRIWLVTTNDNSHALRFYQRREYDLVKVHRDVVRDWRRQKPELPFLGFGGIPVRHALELERRL